MEHGDTNFQKLRCGTLTMRLSLQFLNFKIFGGLYRHSMPQLPTFGSMGETGITSSRVVMLEPMAGAWVL